MVGSVADGPVLYDLPTVYGLCTGRGHEGGGAPWTSGWGERRRTLLARGLAQGARILLLDEPTAHLDPRHQAELLEVLEALSREGAAVLMAIHDINWALEACGRVLLLAGGRLLGDGPPEVTLTPAALQKVYGARARVFPASGGGPGRIRFFAQNQEETS